jgi:hypothetical protein
MADASVMEALDKVLTTYKSGGAFATQRAEQLKGEERRYTAGAQQGLVSRGLSGTTIAASIPSAFEQEVAAPYRTETERLRSGQEMQGLIAKAGFLDAQQEREQRAALAQEEIDAAMKRLQEQIAAQKGATSMEAAGRVAAAKAGRGGGGGAGGGGGTAGFGARAAASAARVAASRTGAGGAGVGAGGATQHIGGGGGFDIGGAGYGGAIPTGPTEVITDPGAGAGAGGGVTSMEDLAKMAQEWMGAGASEMGGDALPQGAVGQDEKNIIYEYYPGGPRYTVDKATGGRRG